MVWARCAALCGAAHRPADHDRLQVRHRPFGGLRLRARRGMARAVLLQLEIGLPVVLDADVRRHLACATTAGFPAVLPVVAHGDQTSSLDRMLVLKVGIKFFFDENCFNESERADYAHKRSRLVEDARGRTLYSFPIKREELDIRT